MPAVTISTTAPFFGKPIVNMNGSERERYYRFDVAVANADYLDVPMRSVSAISLNDDALTAMGITSVTINGYGSRIVFSAAGNTGVYCRVTGH